MRLVAATRIYKSGEDFSTNALIPSTRCARARAGTSWCTAVQSLIGCRQQTRGDGEIEIGGPRSEGSGEDDWRPTEMSGR